MLSGVVFRRAGSGDAAALATLLTEANRHYWGDTAGAESDAQATAAALLGGGSGCQTLLAWRGDQPCGFATYTLLHPAPSARGTLFMKDLFIAATARNAGLGRAFMRHLAGLAAAQGCTRFDWTAESDNPRAIDFYRALGAETVTEKVYFRLTGAALARTARKARAADLP
ncbi:MAG: GNAT family N-acetyltransferase [Pseudomonadota bacterium]